MAVPPALGLALARSISDIRAKLDEPSAGVGVVVPSEVSGVFLRQQLALAGPFIGVEFFTPERLVRDLARAHIPDGWIPEPAAWLRTVVGVLLRELGDQGALGSYAEALRQPGWRRPVARAIERLEAAGLGPKQLAAIDHADLRPRAQLLATVLQAVGDRRSRDRLLAGSDLSALAVRALSVGGHGPGHRLAGAVVVGDKILGPDVYAVLRAWLDPRPHRVLNPPPLSELEPAPRGLRAAATGEVEPVVIAESCALAAVQARLHRRVAGPALRLDASLALVTTPDEVRDIGEAVREVLRGIREGVPLDRIAIVLPDTSQADVLQEALDNAGVPATWLTGPALDRAPESRGLLLAVELANGHDTVLRWYALLSHPGLNLRHALGAEATRGRGRWRKILAKCGAVRGTSAILAAITRWADALEADAHDDRAAAGKLGDAIAALELIFESWRAPDTLGSYKQRFVEFLRRWWRPSARRERLATALSDWGPAGVGFAIDLALAGLELRDTLAQAADLDGRITDPRIRVLSPMHCLGGAFERVCVTGLTHKRLPAEVREDPLVPDALLEALAAKHDVTLLTSRILREFEDRRFAAIVSACSAGSAGSGRLWLASPELEMLTERRQLPSTHLLNVASALAGTRVGYAQLRKAMTRVGSRAQPFPEDPDDALGELEVSISLARQDPAAALAKLAARPDTRRLLGLHRALDADAPTAWTGRVTPELLQVPGLDGQPAIAAVQLRALLQDPGAYLFRQLLGAWPATKLRESWDPRDSYTLKDSIRAAISDAVEQGDPSFEAMLAAWNDKLRARAQTNPHISAEDLAMAQRLAESSLAVFHSNAGELAVKLAQLVGEPFDDLPWRVDAAQVWLTTDSVIAAQRRLPPKRGFELSTADLAMAGRLAANQGVPIVDVAVYDDTGACLYAGLNNCIDEVRVRARIAWTLVRQGWLPRVSAGLFGARLEGERSDDPWDPDRRAAVLGEDSP